MLKDSQKDIKGQILKDKNYQIVLLKTQKLSSALYAITNFMSDMDPLKWQIRRKSLDLLSTIYDGNLEYGLSLIDQFMSLIEIALIAQSVSEMNFSLLKQEYLALKEMIQKQIFPLFSPKPITVGPTLELETFPLIIKSGARQGLIIDFIKGRGGVSNIRDITQAMPNLNSKTVQRELALLVRQGLLKKEGERRWSQYRLTT